MPAKAKIELIMWLCLLGASTFVLVRVFSEREFGNAPLNGTIIILAFFCMGLSFAFIRQLWSRYR